jgi:hypothetical protein
MFPLGNFHLEIAKERMTAKESQRLKACEGLIDADFLLSLGYFLL